MNPSNDKERPLSVCTTERGHEDNTSTDDSIPFFAQNVKVKCCIDTIPYSVKPNSAEIKGISKRTKCTEQIRGLTPSNLLNDYLRKGYTASQSEMSGGKQKDFITQQVFYADIDNSNQGQETTDLKNYPSGFLPDQDELTVNEAKDICKSHGLRYAFIYHTFSNGIVDAKKNPKGWSRYRIVFISEYPVTDPAEAKIISQGIVSMFPRQIDTSTVTVEKMLFGTTPDAYYEWGEGMFNKQIALDLYHERVAPKTEPKTVREYKPPTTAYEGELDLARAYRDFDLVRHIEATTGTQGKRKGKDILFNPCPVCGHMDDFYVDTEKNVFKCHSSADGRGGNILTYLEITLNMSRENARAYFKYTLMGVDREAETKAYRARQAKDDFAPPSYTDADAPPYQSSYYDYAPEYEPVQEPQASAKSILKCFSDVEEKDADFYWYPYIRRGTVTTITATQGTGKSMLMCKLAAMASVGKRTDLPLFDRWWKYKRSTEPETTIYLNAEDDPAEDTKGRLRVCGADPYNVFFISANELGINFYNPLIEEWIKAKRPTALIFDPVQQFFNGLDPSGVQLDMNNSASVRPVMTRLNVMANKYNMAIILICHPNKNNTQVALHSTMGSNDFTAAPRSAIYIGRNPADKEQHVITITKANSVPDRDQLSLAYRIDFHDGGVSFDGVSELQADDVRENKRSSKKPEDEGEQFRPSSKRSEAEAFICDLLENNGYIMTFKDIEKKAKEAKISMSSVYRAKKNLSFVKNSQKGYGKTVYWYYDGYEPPEQTEIK